MASKSTSLVLILLFGLWALETNGGTIKDASMYKRFKEYMVKYGKMYKDPVEKNIRYKIFKETVESVETLQEKHKPL
ncbi:hypothetical protein TanjilG_17135 [Lupinus angustifolius]|uniref:Cathepsin propeptide inhibitor domain-containing protein n=1 Tax=Lupinus angustifolius TaxID=3871 RepID=A0A4P1R1A3_LUPAN|nr:hypothetical protein TanjilG_17135 [Lupinus angustifolius]